MTDEGQSQTEEVLEQINALTGKKNMEWQPLNRSEVPRRESANC